MNERVRGGVQTRENLCTVIGDINYGIPWNYRIFFVAFRASINVAGKLRGKGWIIPKLDVFEESLFREYSKILANQELWDRLSPLEQVDLRGRLSKLAS